MRRKCWVCKDSKNNFKIDRKGIFCGSFNPFHQGHLYVIKQALKEFEFLYIVICQNEVKPLQNFKKIKLNIKRELVKNKIQNKCKILINYGMTHEFVNELDSKTIIRGYRNLKDYWYENKLRRFYQSHNNKINFILYKTNKTLKHLRSSKN